MVAIRKRGIMINKIWALIIIILPIINFICDLASPPTNLYRDLLKTDIK